MLQKIARILLKTILVVTLIVLIFGVYVYHVSDIKPPRISDTSALLRQRISTDTNAYQVGKNWLQKNPYGLYEMYLEGAPFERGVVYGKLAQELIVDQEIAFTQEIKRMIPSSRYLKFLKYMVGFMNRNLSDYVIQEYQEEIYGISLSASHEFDWIGTNYSRQLNYHAAHDIGHALVNMMLVGCTSFATWNQYSADSQLIIGRNFDFYVGDEFAKKKIIAFYRPDRGIPFMSVTWGGFAGVVSGMNLEGLTVTINANKSSIPFGAATPVSLVAREILQYASNIDEAVAIATKRKMFVSESFLIGSAKDHRAVVIEKTPEDVDVYRSDIDRITCANHYQGKKLAKESLNLEQMQQSASKYRFDRLQELLNAAGPNTPEKTAAILRDYKGKNNADIGLTNEKALNQFIAHHSIIFEPEKRLVWVSTSPWQEGAYICYDLKTIFSHATHSMPLYNPSLTIAPDTLLQTKTYQQLQTYLYLEQQHIHRKPIVPMQIVQANPTYYDAYRIAGDVYMERQQKDSALLMYQKALKFEIATQGERESILDKIKTLSPSL
ncbi:MAG: peptidase C45 [Chitinophagaceae bacterium]|nr:peptidase C45 [Chitinophagaceae bacterium]